MPPPCGSTSSGSVFDQNGILVSPRVNRRELRVLLVNVANGRYRQGAKQDLNPWGVVRGAGFDYSIFRVKIQFKYYLHDDASFFERLEDLQAQSHLFTEELVEKMGRPFYEVTLQCEVDTDTGSVTILSTK